MGERIMALADDGASGSVEAHPPGTRAMGIVRWALVGFMALLAAAAWSKGFDSDAHAGAVAARYQCPMHPSVPQRAPGSCPICGMDLVKVADAPAGAARTGPSAPEQGTVPTGLAAVKIEPGRAQLAGVRTEKVTRQRLKPQIRATGAVAVDDSSTTAVDAHVSGWIAGSRLLQVGERVERGQVLAAIAGPEIQTTQEIFLAATQREKQQSQPAARALGRSLVTGEGNALRRLGIADRDIQALARRGRPFDAVPVRSPVSGFVARKDVVAGQYVQPGSELFEIVDLRRVWVMASVPESDVARLKTGQRAQFTVAALPGETFAGQVQFLYPALDAQTRTLQARMELDNPALELRPGMSGDMRIEVLAAETLTVPVEALVDTGEAQYVFLARGGGRYQPRGVRPGSSDGNRVQILEGLSEGDRVVTASSFLVDSESRLRAAIEAFGPTPPDDETQDTLAQHTR